MKKISRIFLLSILSLTASFMIFGVAFAFDGNGTGADASHPFEITNCTLLQSMNGNLSAYYKLMNNVDCYAATHSGGALYNSGAGFSPVGTSLTPFTGTLDGNSNIISGLLINRPTTDDIGLFGYTSGSGSIHDVSLTSTTITGRDNTGVLVGRNGLATISNASAAGTVNGRNLIGGLIGYHTSGTVNNSYATATVTGSYATGGLIGYNDTGTTVTGSYATGAVSGEGSNGAPTGGLMGYNYGAVSSSYATGTVSGAGSGTGGLVGSNYTGGTITTSYATGAVSSSGAVTGGLFGYNETGASITNSYAIGTVNGTGDYVGGFGGVNYGTVGKSYSIGAVSGGVTYAGGFISYNMGGTVTNSFWDKGTSGKTTSGGGGTGKTTLEMKDVATFTAIAAGLTSAWDFVNNPNNDSANSDLWDIDGISNSGYPSLSWQGLVVGGSGVPEFSTYMAMFTLLAGAWMVNKKMVEVRI